MRYTEELIKLYTYVIKLNVFQIVMREGHTVTIHSHRWYFVNWRFSPVLFNFMNLKPNNAMICFQEISFECLIAFLMKILV